MAVTATEKLKKVFKSPNFGDVGAIVALLKKGANPNLRNSNKQTILQFGCWYGLTAVVEAALAAGAKIEMDGGKALQLAVESDVKTSLGSSKEVLRLLIAHGVNVNQVYRAGEYGNDAGANALMLAIQMSQKEKAEMLIAAGTDLHHKDKHGFTALKWAQEMGMKSLCTKLAAATGKKLSKKDVPATDPHIDVAYVGTFTAKAGKHASGIPQIEKVYTAKKFPGCNNPPVHLVTIDLAEIKEFPEKIRKIGALPIVFHNCECDAQDFYDFKIMSDHRAKPLDKMGKNDCTPEDFRNSPKISGIKFSKVGKGKPGGSIVVGGEPRWAQARNDWPSCPSCGKRSFFVAFINQFKVPPGAGGRGNFLNIFVCPNCKTQSIVRQST